MSGAARSWWWAKPTASLTSRRVKSRGGDRPQSGAATGRSGWNSELNTQLQEHLTEEVHQGLTCLFEVFECVSLWGLFNRLQYTPSSSAFLQADGQKRQPPWCWVWTLSLRGRPAPFIQSGSFWDVPEIDQRTELNLHCAMYTRAGLETVIWPLSALVFLTLNQE